MSTAALLVLYAVGLLYGASTYFLAEAVPLITIVFGFGLLVIPYLAMEWLVTPAVAAVMGLQSRWSVFGALLFGVPLIVLYTFVTPVVSSGAESLPVPVPWLSVFSKSRAEVVPIIRERLVWWAALYGLALVAGLLSRRLRPEVPDAGA